jgi:hypothetical protein
MQQSIAKSGLSEALDFDRSLRLFSRYCRRFIASIFAVAWLEIEEMLIWYSI